MNLRFSKYFALSLIFLGVTAEAGAQSEEGAISDVITQSHVDGELRLYNFNRIYDGKDNRPDQHALSSALLLNGTTGSFHGFSIGASLAFRIVTGKQIGRAHV